MAENQADDAADRSEPVTATGGLLGKVWDFFTGSPAINAMARQGLDEAASALKAFPDSVSEYRYNRSYLDDSPEFEPPTSTLSKPDDAAIQPPDTGKVNEADAGYSL